LANPIFALVGSESLLGREVRDLAAAAPALDLRLIAADEEEPGTLTRMGDQPAVISGLDAEALSDTRAVILAGSPESSAKALELAAVPVIDLTNTAEERPEARLRAPLVGDGADDEANGATIHVIAHPAAIALALFLNRLHSRDPIRQSVIQILAPASEHGAKAVEELQNQTVSLFSFKSLPQKIFDAQLGFNLLARYGEEAPVSLEDSELRIERHLATLLARPDEDTPAPFPSLRLVQAPVFHGYSFSAWVDFDETPDIEALEEALVSPLVEVRGRDFDPPTNVGQAGQGGVAVGAITPDRNRATACWFWLVADNLRLAAENAIAVAREML